MSSSSTRRSSTRPPSNNVRTINSVTDRCVLKTWGSSHQQCVVTTLGLLPTCHSLVYMIVYWPFINTATVEQRQNNQLSDGQVCYQDMGVLSSAVRCDNMGSTPQLVTHSSSTSIYCFDPSNKSGELSQSEKWGPLPLLSPGFDAYRFSRN